MKLLPVLRYWRNCLADAEYSNRRFDRDQAFGLDRESIEEGRFPEDLVRAIFDEAETSTNRRSEADGKGWGSSPAAEPLERVGLLITPFVLRFRVEHYHRLRNRPADHGFLAPLWIPAVLDRSGRLSGDPDLAPWVDRQCLEPNGTDSFVVGALEDSDRFRSKSGVPKSDDWRGVLDYAEQLFEEVSGKSLWDPDFEDTVSQRPGCMLKDSKVFASMHLLPIYDQLCKGAQSGSKLLSTLVAGREPAEIPDLEVASARFSRRHLGHMAPAFGLQATQRRALLAALATSEGSVLAVNGPPGTGKTTLIQSVVASLWVERAIAGGEPPLMHACSSNNRAIVNILDTFARVQKGRQEDPFSRRWIPDVSGYGLLMPSGFMEQKYAGRYPMATKGYPGWSGLPEKLETRQYVRRAKASYLEAASEALPPGVVDSESDPLAATVDAIHSRLKETAESCQELEERSRRIIDGFREEGFAGATEALAARGKRIEELLVEIGEAEALENEVETAIHDCPFWLELLAFLPWVRARREDVLTKPFRNRNLIPPQLSLSSFREELRADVASRLEILVAELEEIKSWLSTFEEHREALQSLIDSIPQSLPPRPKESLLLAALDEAEETRVLLDRTLRLRLFHLAGRYWEGRWILETRSVLAEESRKGQSESVCVQRLRRFAKLTPLSVSTFYLLPKLFTYYDHRAGQAKPLAGALDLLIADEAGQTPPEIGALALHYAQRAFIVGDVHQIEPIWGIDSVIDDANAREAGLPEDDAGTIDPLRPSGGSLMALAQRASQWTDGGRPRGVMLREHWRCVPGVIELCNELVYHGRLLAKRPEAIDPPLPPMGWAHVKHRATRRGGSWVNEGQANAIARWLSRRQKFLEESYGDLRNAVGIVTPFRAQSVALSNALRRRNLREIEVGTVHTFQGGEKSVMIFSPVYDASSPKSFFFDRGANMLNVAVSRAKESFLVFGDMEIFEPGGNRPSSVLAEFLFREASQEITDVEGVSAVPADVPVERIDSLEGHRQQLREAFESAGRRVLVVSPYIAPGAILDDQVQELIEEARGRNVEVVVVYSRDLASNEDRTIKAKEMLAEAGAEVWSLDRVHSKTLAVDNQWIAEGSFNWLSAIRDPDHRFQRFEASVVIRPPAAEQMIEDAWKTMRTKRRAVLV